MKVILCPAVPQGQPLILNQGDPCLCGKFIDEHETFELPVPGERKRPPFVLVDEGGIVHLLGDADETTACGAPADFMEAYERPPDGTDWCGFCAGRTT